MQDRSRKKKLRWLIISAALLVSLPLASPAAQGIPPPPQSTGQWTHSRANAAATGLSSIANLNATLLASSIWSANTGANTSPCPIAPSTFVFAGNYPVPVSAGPFGRRVFIGGHNGISALDASSGNRIWLNNIA